MELATLPPIADTVTPMANVWTRWRYHILDWLWVGSPLLGRGTWIAIVSGGSRCFEYWSCSANDVWNTGDTSRHDDQRYVHVSPWESAGPVGDPSGGDAERQTGALNASARRAHDGWPHGPSTSWHQPGPQPFMRVPIRECSDGTWIAIVVKADKPP